MSATDNEPEWWWKVSPMPFGSQTFILWKETVRDFRLCSILATEPIQGHADRRRPSFKDNDILDQYVPWKHNIYYTTREIPSGNKQRYLGMDKRWSLHDAGKNVALKERDISDLREGKLEKLIKGAKKHITLYVWRLRNHPTGAVIRGVPWRSDRWRWSVISPPPCSHYQGILRSQPLVENTFTAQKEQKPTWLSFSDIGPQNCLKEENVPDKGGYYAWSDTKRHIVNIGGFSLYERWESFRLQKKIKSLYLKGMPSLTVWLWTRYGSYDYRF